MQWQPRSMIAPPPVSRPSQNQALCGPGVRLARADPGHVAERALLDRRDRLERLGRVAQVLEVAAEDPGLPRPPRASARLRRPSGPSGFVHSTALPAAADGLTASSCRWLGSATITTSVVGMRGSPPPCRSSLGDAPALAERLAALVAPRVDDPDPVAAALPVQRHRVEVADEAGAEHA